VDDAGAEGLNVRDGPRVSPLARNTHRNGPSWRWGRLERDDGSDARTSGRRGLDGSRRIQGERPGQERRRHVREHAEDQEENAESDEPSHE
jgi:hypothetical protein